MERTQSLMHPDPQSESLRDPLNREVVKLLKFILFHNCQFLRYSSVFVYSPVWFEYVMNFRNTHTRN